MRPANNCSTRGVPLYLASAGRSAVPGSMVSGDHRRSCLNLTRSVESQPRTLTLTSFRWCVRARSVIRWQKAELDTTMTAPAPARFMATNVAS